MRAEPAADEDGAIVEALLAWSGADLIIVVDRRLRISRAGASAAELAGRARAALAGMSLIAAFGSVPLDALARDALERGEPAAAELSLGHPRSRQFQVDALPNVAGGLVLVLHDITRMRRIERVRRDFVANISHELRTPLSSIKLIAETLSSGAVEEAATARDFVQQIEREVDHLAQLVDELLELSLIESGEVRLSPEVIDAETLVGDVIDRMSPLAERRRIRLRRIESPAADAEARIEVDVARIGQALVNLVHNAVKYSHPGGEVRVAWQRRDERIRFTVADDGIGIPAAHQSRIFERFYKVDRARTRQADAVPDELRGGSAGLGLAIVRHIVEAHGGAVGVDSREGIGSTFWLEVPAAA